MNLPIKIEPGTVLVEGISGVVGSDHFLLYVTLREKHAVAECVCENPAIVSIWAEPGKTLRVLPGMDDYAPIDPDQEKATTIELPSGWSVEASVTKYTCRILGIRTPDSEVLILNIPYVVEAP